MHFSGETVMIRKEGHDICKLLKEKKLKEKNDIRQNLDFRNKREIKTFLEKLKLWDFFSTRGISKDMLNGDL